MSCESVGQIVITDETQTFANTSITTVGTCVELSCYTDFYVDGGADKGCCKLIGGVPKWDPSMGKCKLNETANDMGLVASKIQLTDTVCYAVIGLLAGLAALALLFLILALLCCCFYRKRKPYREERVIRHDVIHEYGPQQTVHHTDVRHHHVSQPPSYTSGKPWPSGGSEYPLYYNEPIPSGNHYKREVVDYEKTRNVEDVRPNLWLTYSDSLEGGSRAGYRNRSYEYYEEDRDANVRDNYNRRW